MAGKKLTIEEVKTYIEIESNSGCKLISTEYKGSKEKLDIQCKCGDIFQVSYKHFKGGQIACKKCNSTKYSYSEVKTYIENNSDCKLLSLSYVHGDKKLDIECKCGEMFKISFNKFKGGKTQCNKCSNVVMLDINLVRKYIEENTDCYLMTNEYKNCDTKLKLRCKCGECFYASFDKIKQGKSLCNKCSKKISSNKIKFTYDEVKEYIENNSDCTLISKEYKGCYDKLILRCECGEIFEVCFDKFKNQGNKNQVRCAKCSNKESIPERKIEDILKRENIDHIKQYKFEDCKYKNTLPFDFYLTDYNICIEYDGEFHYEEKFSGNDLQIQKIRDDIKTEYCNSNGIILIRIPYWEQKNLENIMMNIINNLEKVANYI